ncbi:monooxygenase flavin-binding family protein-like protein [Venturia nashicola]|nr:monooxygenase flavin-binding family protein-like protein [Venturia nashicola]
MAEQRSFDSIIIGAGISGINLAYRLQTQLPNHTYTILEARNAIGGTWDLFRYPGIRSDSDLYTFGFPWRPWSEQTSIAEGGAIKKYVRESAEMYGIDRKILFGRNVTGADWRSDGQEWVLQVEEEGKEVEYRSRFLMFCTGYYVRSLLLHHYIANKVRQDYKTPLKTEIPGIDNFQGTVVHPQFWPKDLDYKNKNVVIIGSGATAITLLPAIADEAAQVTMLQRSPSYILSTPKEDGLEKLIRRWAPTSWISPLIRFKWLALPWIFIQFCRYMPDRARGILKGITEKQLPKSLQYDKHFKPTYNPFDQRVCFCPDGDFYRALRKGKANIVTDIIQNITTTQISLQSGNNLTPDIIITATGLKIQLAGGISITIDSSPYHIPQKFIWKNTMFQDLPNASYTIGYVDASWTLGADATAQLITRLIKKMQQKGAGVIVPRVDEGSLMKQTRLLNLSSTYVQRADGVLPMAGDQPQWRGRTSYFRDIWESWYGDIGTGLVYLPLKGREGKKVV